MGEYLLYFLKETAFPFRGTIQRPIIFRVFLGHLPQICRTAVVRAMRTAIIPRKDFKNILSN